MDLKEAIDLKRLPKHVAVIMDGNGRWAKKRGALRVFGHKHAIQAVRDVSEASAELGIEYLTLYTFSTENWNRPVPEISALMQLLVSTIRKEIKTLMDNDIRLWAIGDLSKLPKECQRELEEGIAKTANNQRMTLILALSYSGRWELTQAVNQLVTAASQGKISGPITDEHIQQYLETAGIPDPELMIRTSGEQRISNFLVWQLAYAELYFTDVLWPDFRKEHLYQALLDYQNRERRFGKTGEQVVNGVKP